MKLYISLMLAFSLLLSCSNKFVIHDEEASLSKKEFSEILTNSEARKILKDETIQGRKIPHLSQVISVPKAPQIANNKLVSLNVTEDVPLKDVLIELSRLSSVELELDPFISGGIILSVKNRPFLDVISHICDIANLRYIAKDGILRIERDTPYSVNYNIDYLDITRTSSSSLELSTQTGSSSGDGNEISSGGSNSISTESSGDVWKDIKENIEKMISSGSSESNSGGESYITTNQRAGIITVNSTGKNHRVVKKYLDKVKKNVTAQVLIEAKIVEVSLSKEFQTGINWTKLYSVASGNLNANINTAGSNPFALALSDGKTASDGSATNRIEGTLTFLEEFGTTRTLSSPRLTALNNHQAILSFTENMVYFEIDFEGGSTTVTDGGATNTEGPTIESTVKTIPIGIILALQPSINLEKNEIVMNIKPTISSTSDTESDPGVLLAAASIGGDLSNISSDIPVVELKELDTLLKMKSGQTMVIGGLIEQSNENIDTGVPILKDIPILGYLFKSQRKQNVVTETVILIQATIINTNHEVSDADKTLYRTFSNDPRPFDF